MSNFSELEDIVKSKDFWNLSPDQQAGFVRQELGSIYSDFGAHSPDQQSKLVSHFINEAKPRGLVEQAVEMLPFVGPLAQQYGYGREVEPSPLVRKLFGEQSREAGALYSAAEDLFLLTAGTMGAAFIGAAVGSSILAEGAITLASGQLLRTLPSVAAREALVGTIYEAGRLITTPPSSVGEAGRRVALGAGGFAAGGAVFEKFGSLIGERITNRNLTRLFGSQEAVSEFETRIGQGFEYITEDEIGHLFRAAGDRESASAVELREQAKQLLDGKRAFEYEKLQQQAREQAQVELQNRFRTEYETRMQGANEQERLRLEEIERDRIAAGQQEQEQGRLQAEQMRLQTQAILDREGLERQGQVREQASELELEGSIRRQHLALTEQYEELERERLAQQVAARRARQRATTEETFTSKTSPEIEAQLELERSRIYQRAAQEVHQVETQRQAEVNRMLEGIEQGRREAGRAELTQSEAMLKELLLNENLGHDNFVGQRPITLPLGMLDQNGEAQIVERFTDGQAILRGGKGIIARNLLRLPADEEESALLERLLVREGLFRSPSRSEAISILKERVSAEQKIRLADSFSLREDIRDNRQARVQMFNLRKDAATSFARASNQVIRPEVLEQLANLRGFYDNRLIASLENLDFREAQEMQKALSGAGFENVRLAVTPEGKVHISFSEGDSEAENALGDLYNRYVYRKGTFDATERTYSGLTPSEHTELGKGFAIGNEGKFSQFVTQALDDLSARGLRVPVTNETLGIASIEEQVLSKANQALAPRADAIVDAERLQRFEIGDTLKVPITKDKATLAQVSAIAHTNNGERQFILQGIANDELKHLPLGPMTEQALRDMGSERDITAKLAPDPQRPLPGESPARTLEQLINPESRPARAFQPLEPSYSNVQRGAKELGLRYSKRSSGDIAITAHGMKFNFTGASALEDATRFVNGMRYLREERGKIIDRMGGLECLS